MIHTKNTLAKTYKPTPRILEVQFLENIPKLQVGSVAGGFINFREFDRDRCEGNYQALKWAPIDLADLFTQIGLDLIDRFKKKK